MPYTVWFSALGVNTPFPPPTAILDIAHTLLHGTATHFHAPKPSGSMLLWPHRLDWLLGGVPVAVAVAVVAMLMTWQWQ